MRNMFHFFLFTFVLILFSSCKDSPPENREILFDDKYVKGTVVSIPEKQGELGFLEASKGHDNSYMLIYKYGDIKPIDLYEEYQFKGVSINGIPFAEDIRGLDEELSRFEGVPVTSITYHSFFDHDNSTSIHKIGHIPNGYRFVQQDRDTYTLNIRTTTNSGERSLELKMSTRMKLLLESFKEGKIYYRSNRQGYIVEADTCHRHFGRTIYCRSNEE